MNAYARILLIAKPDLHHAPALERAVRLARRSGAALHLVVFDHRATLDVVARLRAEDMRSMREIFLRQRNAWLAEQAEALRAQGLQVTTEAVWSAHAAEAILAQVGACAADLVVKDVEQAPGLPRPLMSALDWQLMRECPVPVMLVRDECQPPRRIVVAADVLAGDGLNDKLLRQAALLAAIDGAELQLAHVFDAMAPSAAPAADALLPPGIYEAMRRTHEEAFAAFAARHGLPAAQRHFLVGPTAPALAHFAAEIGAELLVLGASYRRRPGRIVIGGTTARLLDALPCSVLVVKSDGAAKTLAARIATPPAPPGGDTPWTRAA